MCISLSLSIYIYIYIYVYNFGCNLSSSPPCPKRSHPKSYRLATATNSLQTNHYTNKVEPPIFVSSGGDLWT